MAIRAKQLMLNEANRLLIEDQRGYPMNREIGVLFDIDGLGGPSSYGTPCWRILMKNLDLSEMPGVVFYQGDLDIQASQRPYCYCIAITELMAFTDGRGYEHFLEKLSVASDPGLFPQGRRFIKDGVTTSLIGTGRVDIEGRFRMSSQLGDLGDLRLVTNGNEFGWKVLPDDDLVAAFTLTYLERTSGEGLPLSADSRLACESVLKEVGQSITFSALRSLGLPSNRLKKACRQLNLQIWPDSRVMTYVSVDRVF